MVGPKGWFDPELPVPGQFDPEVQSAGQFDPENVDDAQAPYTAAMFAAIGFATMASSFMVPPAPAQKPAQKVYIEQTTRQNTPWKDWDPAYEVAQATQSELASYLPDRRLNAKIHAHLTQLQTQPSDAPRIYPLTVVAVTQAQLWPAIESSLDCASGLPNRLRFNFFERLMQARLPTPWKDWDPAYSVPFDDALRNTSFRVDQRNNKPIQTQPNDGWVYAPSTANLPRQWPAIEENTRRDYRQPQRDRSPIQTTPLDGWQYPVTDAAVAKYWPAADQSDWSNERVRQRNQRPITDSPIDGWNYGVTVTLTVAQTSPAWAPAPSFRSDGRPLDRMPTLQTDPNDGWAYTQINADLGRLWPAVDQSEEAGRRVSQRNIAPINTTPLDGWNYRDLNAALATYWPAIEASLPRSYRSLDRNKAPIPTVPSDGWVYGPATSTLASYWPAIELGLPRSYRVAPRPSAPIPTSPLSGWENSVTDAYVAQWTPAFEEATGRSYRVGQRNTRPIDTAPLDGWQYTPVGSTIAQYWPGIDQSDWAATRVNDRNKVPIQTSPLEGWSEEEEEAFIAAYWSAIDQDASRDPMPSRKVDKTYILQTVPEDTWRQAEVDAQLAITWPAVELGTQRSYRSAQRNTSPIPTAPLDGWQYAPATANLGTYWPAIELELRSFRADDRKVDKTFVRQDVPEPAWIYGPATANLATYWPGIELARTSFLVAKRSVDVRPTVPDFAPVLFQYSLAGQQQYWPAMESELLSFRLAERVQDRTHIRQSVPNDGWWKGAVTLFEAYGFPPMGDQQRNASYRAPARSTDVRPTTPNDGWQYTPVTADTARFSPAWDDAQRLSFRAPDRKVDKTFIEQDQPEQLPYYATTAVVAYQWPAMEQELRSFRMDDRKVDRTYIRQDVPEISFLETEDVLFEAIYFVPTNNQERSGFRVPARSTLVHATVPNDGWQYRANDATTAKYYPAQEAELRSFRADDRRTDKTFLRQDEPSDEWRYQNLPAVDPTVLVAPTTLVHGSFRMPDRATDKTYRQQTTPEDGWIFRAADAQAAKYWPAIDAGHTYRMPERVVDKTYIRQTTPNSGWEFRAQDATTARYWPAMEGELRTFRVDARRQDRDFIRQDQPQPNYRSTTFTTENYVATADAERNASFRVPDRQVDRTYIRQDEPETGWLYNAQNDATATNVGPIDQLGGSYRMPDRASDRTYVQQTTPNDGWQYPALSANVATFFPGTVLPSSYLVLRRSVDVRETLTLLHHHFPSDEIADQFVVVQERRTAITVVARTLTIKVSDRRTTPVVFDAGTVLHVQERTTETVAASGKTIIGGPRNGN